MSNEEMGSPEERPATFDRRRGPRRSYAHIDPETGERRTHDRRKTPGVEALFDRLLGVRETLPEPEPSALEPERDKP